MNKYIVPIADCEAADVWNEVIVAISLEECQDKLMNRLYDMYGFLDICDNYSDFITMCDDDNIFIGSITDIEEL